MSSKEEEHLIKMINQIADNIATDECDDVQARGVATHVKKFWAPSMIKTLTEYAQNDGEKLKSVPLQAISLLSD